MPERQALDSESGPHSSLDLNAVLEMLPAAAYTCDPQGLIAYFNRRAVELWGREPKLFDPVDRYCGSFRLFSPDGGVIPHEECWMALALRQNREFAEQEIVIERPDGGRRFVLAYARPFHSEDGGVRGAVNVLVDVTGRGDIENARRAADERFASFMRHLPAAAWIKDAEGRYTYANAHAERIFRTPLDELLGKTDFDIFPPEIANEFRANDRRVRESREAVETIEQLEHDGDGVHDSIVSKFPIVERGGKVELIGGVAIDVTEQRRTMRALRESESRLRGVLDNARACIFAKDLKGRYIIANQGMAELFGWPDPSFGLGRTDYELHSLEAAEAFVANDRKVLETGEPVEVEETVERPDGRRVFLVLKFPLRDAVHRIYAVCGIATDITERKQAAEALRESEERYRQLAELLPVGLYTCRAPDGAITYYNREAVRAWGRTPVPGDADARFCGSSRLFRPDGAPLPHADSPMAVTLRDGTAFRNEEVIVERLDGERAAMLMNIDPIRDSRGRLVGAVNVFHDVSALRTAEQQVRHEKENLQTLLATLPVAVLIAHDPECVRIVGNPAASRLLRMPLEANLSKTAPEDERPTHFRVLRQDQPVAPDDLPVQRAARGEPVSREELVHELDDGTRIHTLVSAQPLFDRGGRPRGAVASLLDVSELKNAEAALREADRRKDEFLATLGHELRNPLAPIRMGLELMAMLGDDPERMEQTRAMMERQTQQLIALVNELLDVSRITRGKIELRRQRVPLTDVIRDAVEASRPWIEQAGHELIVDALDDGIVLDGDPNRLTQVLANLLNNACKYTPPGGHIWLSAKRRGREVDLSVKDDGIGIAGAMLNRIFEMFMQVEGRPEKPQSGLGLGLPLVKALVEMHGGGIEVESAGVGQGSVFTIHLPVLEKVETEHGRSAPAVEDRTPTIPRRVLIVDDNQAVAGSLSMVLEALGHETSTAGAGAEAIDLAARFRPDVVIMDLGMPGMNGYEAARRIREQPWGKNMFLVALSGWGQDEHKARAIEAGFDRHLIKPAEPAELQRLIAQSGKQTA